MNSKIALVDELDGMVVCSTPCTIHDTGAEAVCVRHTDGRVLPLDTGEAHLLRRMSTSKPLSEWIEILCSEDAQRIAKNQQNPSSTPGNVEPEPASGRHREVHRQYAAAIQQLLERGLLATAVQPYPAMHGSEAARDAHCRITALCIPTCARGEYLYRCTDSFSRSLRAHGRSDASIVIVDDSGDRQVQSAKRAMIQCTPGPGWPAIHFIGDEKRECLIAELTDRRIAPRDLIRFALRPERRLITPGATRNTILLLTAGSSILQVDDDTTCAFARPASDNAVVRISSSPDPYQTRFYRDRESNIREFPPSEEIDAFAMHESLLGKSFAGLSREGKIIAWDGVTPSTVASLYKTDSHIDLTTTGMSGDPGRRSSAGFLMLAPADTLRGIYSSPETYRTATNIREVMRAVPASIVTRGGCFQSLTLGVNNTRLMPPFFPLGRNEDGAFAELYCKADERSWIGHLPYAISHQSEPNRSYDASAVESVCRPILTDIIELCMSSACVASGGGRGQLLRCVGEQFVAFGSMSPVSFRSFLRNLFIQRQLSMMSFIEERVSSTAFQDERWRSDMQATSASICKSIADDSNIVASDLSGIYGQSEVLEVTQAYVMQYGQLLLLWEDMHAAAGRWVANGDLTGRL